MHIHPGSIDLYGWLAQNHNHLTQEDPDHHERMAYLALIQRTAPDIKF